MDKKDVNVLFESKFLKVYDLLHDGGAHYFNASRRGLDDLVATKTEEEFKSMLPDAISCVVIMENDNEEPKLLLTYEYRYPSGQYLLSVPAGLIDPEDKLCDDAHIRTAVREIKEETGITVGGEDRAFVINPLLFSTPGMTDESNGLVCVVLKNHKLAELDQSGAVGSEKFDGFSLISKGDARKILADGRDEHGIFYSIFTWAGLMYFVSDMWK